ncbi:biogenesis of lysosome-related organelles complex 1 subunit 2-like [Octodon degus]|uniref:Biogenesis of lysosome-related organelles complex 1 subunit 2-like n=1 Tax=Octodon degus TaxID=10160 RepID=A0A6P3VBG8_OCTDE|nr:biogenesis of lysosome-related organelles complex 1 subunit 2-like [Octodon degus]
MGVCRLQAPWAVLEKVVSAGSQTYKPSSQEKAKPALITGEGSSSGPGIAAAECVPAMRREELARGNATVQTAKEAKGPAEATVTELRWHTFSKMAVYLPRELTANREDCKFLENMTKLTSLKYLEMKDTAIIIDRSLKDLNQKYAELQPHLDQINVVEEQVAALEQAAYKLDARSQKLEAE